MRASRPAIGTWSSAVALVMSPLGDLVGRRRARYRPQRGSDRGGGRTEAAASAPRESGLLPSWESESLARRRRSSDEPETGDSALLRGSVRDYPLGQLPSDSTVTANTRRCPSIPLNSRAPRSLKLRFAPATTSRTVSETRISPPDASDMAPARRRELRSRAEALPPHAPHQCADRHVPEGRVPARLAGVSRAARIAPTGPTNAAMKPSPVRSTIRPASDRRPLGAHVVFREEFAPSLVAK